MASAGTIAQFATGYSNPFEGLPDTIHRDCAATVLTARLDAALARWGMELHSCSDGLVPALEQVVAELRQGGAAAVEAAWHPFATFAPLARADIDSALAVRLRAAMATLRLAACRPMEAELRIGIGARLAFDRYRLPEASAVRVEASAETCRITLPEVGQSLRFERWMQGWRLVAGCAEQMPLVKAGDSHILVYPLPRTAFGGDPKVVLPPPDGVRHLQQALDLLQVAPSFASWVARCLRVVVPLRRMTGRYDSESFLGLPGAAMISLHPDTVRTAETLVHESAHDHLHLVMSLDALVEPGAQEQFWSPPKKEMRPTIGILKACHAFSNVLCFYYVLMAKGSEVTSRFAREVRLLEEWHAHFTDCLDRSRYLTPVGEVLWRPLAGRVDMLRQVFMASCAA